MKRMFAALLSLTLFAALLSGCAGREPVSSGKAGGFSIVATSFPAYDLARAVCGQAAEITLLLPPGTSWQWKTAAFSSISGASPTPGWRPFSPPWTHRRRRCV